MNNFGKTSRSGDQVYSNWINKDEIYNLIMIWYGKELGQYFKLGINIKYFCNRLLYLFNINYTIVPSDTKINI